MQVSGSVPVYNKCLIIGERSPDGRTVLFCGGGEVERDLRLQQDCLNAWIINSFLSNSQVGALLSSLI